jgi:hypothetical protein
MPLQSKSWIDKALLQYRSTGYADLYWIIEADLPRKEYAIATYPTGFVPLVPVVPDPEITRHWAHLLLEVMRPDAYYPIYTQLAHTQTLHKAFRYYEWGDTIPIDLICDLCGAVVVAPHTSLHLFALPYLCDDCWRTNGAKI